MRTRLEPVLLCCAVALTAIPLVSCGGREDAGAPSTDAPALSATLAQTGSRLAGTKWRLVEFQSMDDAQGVTRPERSATYTMELGADGRVSMRLNCNSATGSWLAEPGADGASGTFAFGLLAMTRALCPPPSLDEKIARDAEFIRSFLLRDGRLYLSLMADAGIYAWEPEGGEIGFATTRDSALEAAILDAAPDYTKAIVGDTVGRYLYSRVDLNGDGADEAVVYLLGPFFCGTGGCNLLIFSDAASGYSLVGDFPITRTPLIVAEQRSAGWNDIWRLRSGGGAPANYVAGRFDGRAYADGEQIDADSPPPGQPVLAGELTFEQGFPLEPRR